jgi:hypothetical protein
MIEGFDPVGPCGRMNAYRDKVQEDLKAHLQKEQARGVNLEDVAVKISDYITRCYRQIEQQHERSDGGQGVR